MVPLLLPRQSHPLSSADRIVGQKIFLAARVVGIGEYCPTLTRCCHLICWSVQKLSGSQGRMQVRALPEVPGGWGLFRVAGRKENVKHRCTLLTCGNVSVVDSWQDFAN